MRLLVCGNRNWTCVRTIESWLVVLSRKLGTQVTMIHGAAPGADTIAETIAETIAYHFGWAVEAYPADWSLGRKAGPIRNQYMFDHGLPERCIAFGSLVKPNGNDDSGTGNMVKICNRGGIVVTVVPRPGVLP